MRPYLVHHYLTDCGVKMILEDVTAGLAGLGCYSRQTDTIRELFPDFDPEADLFKIHLPGDILAQDRFNHFMLTVESADGRTATERLGTSQLLGINVDQAERAYRDLMTKHRTTDNMRHMPLTAHP